jgi:hypothetical protein
MQSQLPTFLCFLLFSYVNTTSSPCKNEETPLLEALYANLWDFTPEERQALSSGRDSLGIK